MSHETNTLTELVAEILQSEGPYLDDEQKAICRVRYLLLLLGKLLLFAIFPTHLFLFLSAW
jgi:hypothetical protein